MSTGNISATTTALQPFTAQKMQEAFECSSVFSVPDLVSIFFDYVADLEDTRTALLFDQILAITLPPRPPVGKQDLYLHARIAQESVGARAPAMRFWQMFCNSTKRTQTTYSFTDKGCYPSNLLARADGTFLISVMDKSNKFRIIVISPQAGSCKNFASLSHRGNMQMLVEAQKSQMVFVACKSYHKVSRFSKEGNPLLSFERKNRKGYEYINAIAPFPDGDKCVLATGEALELWNCKTGSLFQSDRGHFRDARIAPNGDVVAAAIYSSEARVHIYGQDLKLTTTVSELGRGNITDRVALFSDGGFGCFVAEDHTKRKLFRRYALNGDLLCAQPVSLQLRSCTVLKGDRLLLGMIDAFWVIYDSSRDEGLEIVERGELGVSPHGLGTVIHQNYSVFTVTSYGPGGGGRHFSVSEKEGVFSCTEGKNPDG